MEAEQDLYRPKHYNFGFLDEEQLKEYVSTTWSLLALYNFPYFFKNWGCSIEYNTNQHD